MPCQKVKPKNGSEMSYSTVMMLVAASSRRKPYMIGVCAWPAARSRRCTVRCEPTSKIMRQKPRQGWTGTGLRRARA